MEELKIVVLEEGVDEAQVAGPNATCCFATVSAYRG
jgi:hypothetical protein